LFDDAPHAYLIDTSRHRYSTGQPRRLGPARRPGTVFLSSCTKPCTWSAMSSVIRWCVCRLFKRS